MLLWAWTTSWEQKELLKTLVPGHDWFGPRLNHGARSKKSGLHTCLHWAASLPSYSFVKLFPALFIFLFRLSLFLFLLSTNELNSPNPSALLSDIGFFFKLGIISEVSLCTLSCSCISVIQVSSLNNHTAALMLFTWKELCFIDGKCCNALSCQDENLKKKLFIVYATWNLYTESGCRENIFKYTYAMTIYSKLNSPGMWEWAQEHIPTAEFLAWAQSSSTLPSHFQV